MNTDNHINLNNYESWLLLYVDHELLPEEKQAVNEFAAKHTHVQQELDALLQTIQRPDAFVVFEWKEDMIKNADNQWSDEKLLLYLDSELAADEAAKIASANDETTVKRLEILKNTYLQPDEIIVFPDKKKLYKTGKVVAAINRYPKLAAAAIVTLIIGSWLYFWQQEKDSIPQNPISQFIDTTKDTIVAPALLKPQLNNVQEEPAPPKTIKKIVTNSAPEKNENISSSSIRKKLQQVKEIRQVTSVAPGELPIVTNNEKRSDLSFVKDVQLIEKAITIDQRSTETAVARVQTISENKKNTFLKKLSAKVKERAMDILSDDGENINVAGFAININK